jgi:stalled ribosome rescue protein Dom34
MKEITIMWIDSKIAKIITVVPAQIMNSIKITADEISQPEFTGSSELIKHKKKVREKYYKTIAPHLEHSKEIVIFGPDNTKEEFLEYLNAHVSHIFSKVIGVESSQDMPEEKIIARGKKYI